MPYLQMEKYMVCIMNYMISTWGVCGVCCVYREIKQNFFFSQFLKEEFQNIVYIVTRSYCVIKKMWLTIL